VEFDLLTEGGESLLTEDGESLLTEDAPIQVSYTVTLEVG
jgi:hypothetical protein